MSADGDRSRRRHLVPGDSPHRPLLFGSLRGYRRGWIRGDVLAGFTVWAVLVPESLAYATIAGVPPVVGLYAAPAALVFYALLGSSRHLVVGPMSATAALSASVVAGLVSADPADYAAVITALALVVGAVAVAAGVARLGFLAGFISEPVLRGFIVGLALTIIAGQLPKLFGVDKGEGDFFAQLTTLVTSLGQTHVLTLVVGVGSLVVVLGLKRLVPLLPASLVVVVLGIAAVVVFGLDHRGVAIVGPIAGGLPEAGLPALEASRYLDLVAGAVGVVLVGFAEGLGAAKTYAARAGYEVDADRELLGLGAANLASGLCSGMVVNGSLSKTAVNGAAGARSQVSGLVAAVLTVVTLLFLTGLFERLPEATLAAVVIAAVVELVDVPALVRLYRLWTTRLASIYGIAARADFAAALAALLGVLVFDTLPGLFVGIAVSMLLLLYRASRPHVAELGPTGTPGLWADVERGAGRAGEPAVLVLRVESGLFFANADFVRRAVRARVRDADTPVRAVVIDAETVAFIDLTAAEMLADLARALDREGVTLRLARNIGQVRDVLREANSPLRVHPTVDEAVRASDQ